MGRAWFRDRQYRGCRKCHATAGLHGGGDLLNNGDILSLTRPEVIGDIHKRFYEAGSDICEKLN